MSITLSSPDLEAQISVCGAELVSLRDEARRDLLWDGDPAFWTGRSPLLFPIVGRLNGDRARIDNNEYELKQHGFARHSEFEVIEARQTVCRLRLKSNEATLIRYPFGFQLDVTYSIAGATLTVAAEVVNSGSGTMPVSFGFHPAFRWPLPYGGDRDAHEIRFERAEPSPIRLLSDGLLGPYADGTPVEGDRLRLRDALFDAGALVIDWVASRTVEYGVPGRRSIRVAFPGMPHLGIWTKPGAGFVCIEPWQGHADPVGFEGQLSEKPGIVLIGPGDTRSFSMEIAVSL
jgi:galactose mutarotase-like enzyme